MSADYEVRWLDDGAVFVVDRPTKLNALTKAVFEGLAGCLDALEQRGQRLLVIRGRGEKAFCAGTDLSELQSMPVPARLAKNDMSRDLLVRLSRSPVISVAAINGLALGGGLELAMACTLRIAVANAIFGLPEIKLALLPAYAGTQFLPAIVGRARAEELMLTGRSIDLNEAMAIGLVHRAIPAEADIEETAIAFGREVTAQNAAAVAAIRACVAAAGAEVGDAGLRVEAEQVRTIFASADAQAGVDKFLTRRNR